MKDTLTLVPTDDGKYFVKINTEIPLWAEQVISGRLTVWAASEKLATAFSLQQIIRMYPENPIEFEKNEK